VHITSHDNLESSNLVLDGNPSIAWITVTSNCSCQHPKRRHNHVSQDAFVRRPAAPCRGGSPRDARFRPGANTMVAVATAPGFTAAVATVASTRAALTTAVSTTAVSHHGGFNHGGFNTVALTRWL